MHKPIGHLVYTLPQSLEKICDKIADLPLEVIIKTFDSYSPITIADTFVDIITIPHILYDDIKDNSEYLETYEKLLDKYGQEFMDIIVIKDTELIMEKVISVINLIFESYNSNEILIHVTSSYMNLNNINDNSKYLELIYYAIQKNFNIKYQSPVLGMVIIERRNENGNGN